MKTALIISLFILTCFVSSTVIATTYYVNDETGDDAYNGLYPGPGTFPDGPKKTIQAGIDAGCGQNYGLSMDNEDDYIHISSPNINVSAGTFEAWAKFNSPQTYRALFDCRDDTPESFNCIHLGPRNSDIELYMSDALRASFPDSDLQPGVWYHIAGTWDIPNQRFRVYLNGVGGPVGTDSVPVPEITNVCIGKRRYRNDHLLDGTIDEIRIWNYARTEQEINQTMNQQLDGNEAGLIAYLPLDEGAGQVVHDLSGNNNDAQLGDTSGADSSDPVWVTSDSPITISNCVVIVADGTYTGVGNKDLDFGGHTLTLKSENGPENTIIDCEGSDRGFVFHSGEGPDSLVDGFTIQNGYSGRGAGIHCADSSPTIMNCIVRNNSSTTTGGGIYYSGNNSIGIVNCIITENSSAGHGGGLDLDHATVTLSGCTIKGNSAGGCAGGVDTVGSTVTIDKCLFETNSAQIGGGISVAAGSQVAITNCILTGNSATEFGGAIHGGENFTPIITNCTISGNTAGTYGGAMHWWQNTNPTITNCILWGNHAPNGHEIALRNPGSSSLTTSHCDVEGGQNDVYVESGFTLNWGQGNIDDDPLFADADNDDYHLLPGSPCIDAGTSDGAPEDDIDGDSRPHGLGVDIGADEFTHATYYVDDTGGDDSYDGLLPEWNGTHGPKKTIQAGIDASTDGDTIIVADGMYRGDGNRDLDFSNGLPEGQTRAITLKSENGAENTIIDCEGTDADRHRGFYLHSGESEHTVIDGFTIRNGYAHNGGAICCIDSSLTIVNCIITNNISTYCGGAIYSVGDGNKVTVIDCVVRENSASACGGAFYPHYNSLTIRDCIIEGNSAGNYAGGIDTLGSTVTVENSRLISNSATRAGAISIAEDSNVTMVNCVLAGNSATDFGGAIHSGINMNPLITSCTIIGNTAGNFGGGIHCMWATNLSIRNCILWGNHASHGPQLAIRYLDDPASLTVSYSDVQGGQAEAYVEGECSLNWGEGNIDEEPLFVDPGYDDFHLLPLSSCVDAGDPASDYSNEPLPNGCRINMGAYGNTLEATPSPGDVDGDLNIDMDDLILVYDAMGSGVYDPALDIDGDGMVTFADLRIVHRHMCQSEQYVGGISTLWVLDYMDPTDPSVEGLNPYEDQSQMDNDDDGKTNYEEYIAGTDPTDASSLFGITEIDFMMKLYLDSVSISWSAVPDKNYCLYYSETLGEGAEWIPAGGDYEVIDGIATQVLDVDGDNKMRFFKVKVW